MIHDLFINLYKIIELLLKTIKELYIIWDLQHISILYNISRLMKFCSLKEGEQILMVGLINSESNNIKLGKDKNRNTETLKLLQKNKCVLEIML